LNSFYWLIKGLAWPILKLYFRFRRYEIGRIPMSGSCIVVGNHTSYLDAAVLGSACPRRLNFMISAEIYALVRLRWFYYMMGAIPLKTEGGDSGALRKALHLLRAGKAIGIFPEGQRMKDGQMGEGKLGFAFLAWRSGAPVIPAAIVGAHSAMPVGAGIPRPMPVHVVFGEPFVFSSESRRPDKDEMNDFANQVMDRIAELAAIPETKWQGKPAGATPEGSS
jgi:1-acyl-sn-glycerol-3-phosphate acyltransferase